MNSSTRRVNAFMLFVLLVLCGLRLTAQGSGSKPQPTGNPGFYRIVLGKFQITALSDGTVSYPMDNLLTNTSPTAVNASLASFFITEPYPTSINCFLVNTGNRLILIDTGGGTLLGPTLGKLLNSLAAAGYTPSQINEVYLTHMHVDHEGGLMASGKRAFPNAILRVNRKDAEFWLSPGQAKLADRQVSAHRTARTQFIQTNFTSTQQMVDPYITDGSFKTFEYGDVLAPGITAQSAAGHTPGHTIFEIRSEGQRLLIWGDIVHVAQVQLGKPAVTILFDSNPEAARTTRSAVLSQAASDKVLIAGAHIAFPGLGHVRQMVAGSVFEWVPLSYGQLQPTAENPQ